MTAEKTSPMLSKFIIDGIPQELTPLQLLDGVLDDSADNECAAAGSCEIIDETVDPVCSHYKYDAANVDGLNFLAGKHVDQVNKMAELGTRLAHIDGGVPNIRITLPELDEYWLGQLIYMFEKACGISGYLLGVNPFDQPGVEAYKKNMFALLDKPGYEKESALIKEKIKGLE